MPDANIPVHDINFSPPLHEIIKKKIAEYGWIAICVGIFGSYFLFIWNVTTILVQRADNQATANEKIGILEGKMEVLLQEKTCIVPTPASIQK